QQRTRDHDPPRRQDVAPDRREEQPTERSEGDQRDPDPAAGTDRVVPHHEGPSGSNEQNQQRVSDHDRYGGVSPPAAGHGGRRARQRADPSGYPSRALTPCKVGSVTEPVLNVRHASARHGPERDRTSTRRTRHQPLGGADGTRRSHARADRQVRLITQASELASKDRPGRSST